MVPNSHLRKSTRTSKPPSYLQAYHCSQVTSIPTSDLSQSGTSHPLSSFLSYNHLSPSYKTFVVPYLLLLNHNTIIKLCLTLNGKLPWMLKLQHWRLIIPRLLFLSHLTKRKLVVSGFSELSIDLMALWRGIKKVRVHTERGLGLH